MAEKKVNIIWTEKAEEQLFSILDYWIKRNKSNAYALKLIDEVEDKLSFVAKNPYASVSTDFPETRKCSMKQYSILYKINTDIIFITAFWNNCQDPTKLDQLIED